MKPKLAIFLALLFLLIVFFAQNTRSSAEIVFLFWDWDVTTAAAILVSTLIGFILGLLIPRLLRQEHREKEKPKADEASKDK